MPSKRPHDDAPGPAASAATRPLRQRRPARAHEEPRARRARPPRRWRAPGRRPSSPCRGRRRPAYRRPSGACRARARGCRWRRAPRGPPRALPARLTPSGPGNISGKMVRTLARHMDSSLDKKSLRRSDDDAPARGVIDLPARGCRPNERHQVGLPPAPSGRNLTIRSPGAEIMESRRCRAFRRHDR